MKMLNINKFKVNMKYCNIETNKKSIKLFNVLYYYLKYTSEK